jgi:hypothetical protein
MDNGAIQLDILVFYGNVPSYMPESLKWGGPPLDVSGREGLRAEMARGARCCGGAERHRRCPIS